MATQLKSKHQRLVLVLLAVAALIGAALLAMSALRDKAAFFLTPSDFAAGKAETGQAARLGGMVVKGSLKRGADGVSISFMVSDGKAQVPAKFTGIVPDLFREGSGVVAEGRFGPDGTFQADNLLAKHDERYMPRELDGMTYDEKTHTIKGTPN